MAPFEGAPGWAHHLQSGYMGRSGVLAGLTALEIYLNEWLWSFPRIAWDRDSKIGNQEDPSYEASHRNMLASPSASVQ